MNLKNILKEKLKLMKLLKNINKDKAIYRGRAHGAEETCQIGTK